MSSDSKPCAQCREMVQKLTEDRDRVQKLLDAELPKAWREDIESLERSRELLEAQRDEQDALRRQRQAERDEAYAKIKLLLEDIDRLTKERNMLASQLAHAEADAEQAVTITQMERDDARSEVARLRSELQRLGCP